MTEKKEIVIWYCKYNDTIFMPFKNGLIFDVLTSFMKGATYMLGLTLISKAEQQNEYNYAVSHSQRMPFRY